MPEGPIPIRTSLIAESIRVMKQRISDNEWPNHLPGERSLADMLHVGRDTIRIVLQELENEGWILPAQPGTRRQVAPRTERKSKPLTDLRIGVLSPQPLERLQQAMLLELDQIRGALAAKGGSLEFYSPRWHGLNNPAQHLSTLVAEARCSTWILLRSTPAIQRWFHENRVRCLIRGYPHSGIELPFLDVDWEATARHAAGRLWRLGHKRVGIIIAPGNLLGSDAALRGIHGFDEQEFEAIEIVEDGTREGLCRAAETALRSATPPTAFITTRPRHAATLLTWFGSLGVKVPSQISIISLAHEQFLDYLIPEVDSYRTDAAAVARRVIRRLESLSSGAGLQKHNGWIIPKPTNGQSTANRG